MKLILASASPRRARLLTEAGIDFDIVAPEVDEVFDPALTPAKNAVRVALLKADSVAICHPASLTLAADTIVILDGQIMGKPEDEKHARDMLARLAGREHEVITGLAIVHIDSKIHWSAYESSSVRLAEISQGEIEKYVAEGEPMDKAGAYAIQGGAKQWVAWHKGSYTNIIGLPMERVKDAFIELGYEIKMESAQCR